MSLRALMLVASVVALTACASGQPRCEKPQVHDDAQLGQALSTPPELRLPPPDDTMTIPAAGMAEGQHHPRMRPDGTCLEQPPRFEPPETGR